MSYRRKVLIWMLLMVQITSALVEAGAEAWSSSELLQPMGTTEYRVMNSTRRRLSPYQLCLLCKCCAGGGGGSTSTCVTVPCCFGIDCQLPNKPYGVCAFVPKTCNCTSCAS